MIGERPDRLAPQLALLRPCYRTCLFPQPRRQRDLSVNVKNIGLGGPWNCGDPRIYLSPNRGA